MGTIRCRRSADDTESSLGAGDAVLGQRAVAVSRGWRATMASGRTRCTCVVDEAIPFALPAALTRVSQLIDDR